MSDESDNRNGTAPTNQPFIDAIKRIKNINLAKIFNNFNEYNSSNNLPNSELYDAICSDLKFFPNNVHPNVFLLNDIVEEKGTVVDTLNIKKEGKDLISFENCLNKYQIGRHENLGNVTGPKSYYYFNNLALLERALFKYIMEILIKNNFIIINSPSIIHKSYIEGCGFPLDSVRDQIYYLNPHIFPNICMAGTSEIPLASYFSNITFLRKELPIKVCAISRCYRAEITSNKKEHGLYRVNYFDKLEMFAITSSDLDNQESENMLKHFVSLQKEIYSNLGLHLRVLEMAGHELGLPAYHKFDIESWMPARKIFGEISSASNCTDFQSRRLNIKYIPDINDDSHDNCIVDDSVNKTGTKPYCFVHTVNGTACAIPRLMISLIETHYEPKNNFIKYPKVLLPFLNFFYDNDINLDLAITEPIERWSQRPLKTKR
ncbi:serine--tRNA ligase, mitochondrial-like [Gordionus sp. m RMFG-2023]|uniref:serine--tRNA ligase, mitochondrial-like n=1 Tax=Gordionus sp. m RMFG-2023 TaxID=3053472 RepID=UPI0031FE2749